MTRILFALVLALSGAPAFAQSSDTGPLGGLICDSAFALCTSAPCTPDPSDPDAKAICSCEVTSGPNYGALTSCDDRQPTPVGQRAMRVISTYAFNQAATKPVMTCNGPVPWTYCLDAPCTVDPRNPLKAICTCDVLKSGSFVTYGGDCNTNTCENAVWSGASLEDFQIGSAALMKFMGLQDRPYRFCPGQAPG